MAQRHGTNSKHPRRRLAARRPVAAYGRTVERWLLLILIASAPFLIGERAQSWDVLAGAGALAHVAAFPKFDASSIFAIIGITSPWILPIPMIQVASFSYVCETRPLGAARVIQSRVGERDFRSNSDENSVWCPRNSVNRRLQSTQFSIFNPGIWRKWL